MKKTELGYPVISDGQHREIFGKESRPTMGQREQQRAKTLLKQFDIPTPVYYPEGLYDGPLPLPKLRGNDLGEHFEAIAADQVGHYKDLADEFSACDLPAIPPAEEFLLEPGWVRYEAKPGGGWLKQHVDQPLEEALTFDTETYVHGGSFPIIGTALSAKASYVWIASELLDPTIPQDLWDQYSLIPIGRGKFIAGHNISYDRVRARDGYSLEGNCPENFYFDTLSAHVGVSGLASHQRWLYVLAGKEPEDLTEDEKRKLRFAPRWLEKGSTNSLVQCYNFHVAAVRNYLGKECRELGSDDKKVRDIFVTATDLQHIRNLLLPALDYALKDAYYTAELFQALWSKYLNSTPSMVALAGHYHLNGSLVPLAPDWPEWIERVEKSYDDHNEEMTGICADLVQKYYDEWKGVYETDPEEAQRWADADPWLCQLNWEVRAVKGKYAHTPEWIRVFVKDPDTKIGVKSNLSHLLLKLKWEGSPMVHTRESGWQYTDEKGVLCKIPHPKKPGDNVGGVLSKDFVEDMAVGRLSSDIAEAKRALVIANAVSYWTSVRRRVMGRIFHKIKNPHGADVYVTLPEILAHGTVTRRTVESLMVSMCSTKNWRIGTELKTRVVAPEGWKIVGADFDGQELNIASIYSDSWEGGHIGCSPFGFSVLSGSKEKGTDPHSSLARAVGLDRDTAKAVGFSMLYGAGAHSIQNFIRTKYPDKSPTETKKFAFDALAKKKGKLRDGVYEGGSDSGAYNYMERIAMRSSLPQLPCLGTKISTAMRPAVVGDEFKTGRINWTIQASGAEILSIILTATHWLATEFKVPYRFALSIHDELWMIVPEKYATQFAVVFQMAHLYTWSLFQQSVGIPDMPLSRAFFSSVAIDTRVRKSPNEKTVTPSNPQGADEEPGVEYTMLELAEMGEVKKLTTRYKAIQEGLI